ncbi:MAG: glutamate racemase [Rikenellaceae bacterium]|nr:glutamate racemase [Rikenellaceae bacterium]
MNNAPIGIYDSGMGGLSVWQEVRKALPEESLIYLGDGKNCPYGSRPSAEIRQLAQDAVEHLLALGCKLIVVACNTATAAAIDHLRESYPTLPIVGMEPAIKPASLATKSRVVGVVATERSLDGDLFRRTAARYGADIEVLTAVGEGFVELVEANLEHTEEAYARVKTVIEPMLRRGADQVVLGCTHYPFLREAFLRVGEEYPFTLVDAAPAVARRVVELLSRHALKAESGHRPEYRFETFADEAYRERLASKVNL